ncbi:MAG TPA: NUDIX domain-containing protein [Phycisphaerales bacterium]|nr:NUDIX domain-containing protein [Phycisphaerales bacterium]
MPILHPATFIPLGCALAEIRIEIDPAEPPAPTPDMAERWAAACARLPRLFNGPILRFRSFDPARGVVRASRETYLRYTMQRFDAAASTPESTIHHLAVTGVVTAPDGGGREHVLLGRRGEGTLLYPGRWELAPGGGLDSADIYGQLLQEMEEELGIAGLVDGSRRNALLRPPGPTDVLGIAIDPNAPSADVVVRVRLGAGAGEDFTGQSWEYGATRWIPLDEVGSLTAAAAGELIPPTLAILRGLGPGKGA